MKGNWLVNPVHFQQDGRAVGDSFANSQGTYGEFRFHSSRTYSEAAESRVG